MKINAVEIMYVESCYNISISKYKKSKSNIKISMISNLPFGIFCFSIKKIMTLCQMQRKSTSFLKQLMFRTAQMVWQYNPHVAIFLLRLQNQTHLRICSEKYKGLPVEGQYLNSSNETDQGQALILRRTFTVIDRTLYQGYRRLTLE